jgi:DNA-binding NtrC family response regulator
MLPRWKVLVMMESEWEADDVQGFLGSHAAVTCVRSLGELRVRLGRGQYDAVFCGRAFRSGSWREVLKAADDEAPGVPTIVLAKDGDGRDWREAVGAGAFDLVKFPVPYHTLLGILEQAAASQQARARWSRPLAATDVVPA